MDIDTKALRGLSGLFEAAGQAVADYVEALQEHDRLDNIAMNLGADCHVLQQYIDGDADDDILSRIESMTEEEGLSDSDDDAERGWDWDEDEDDLLEEDRDRLMDFGDAKILLGERSAQQTANDAKLDKAEEAVARTRRTAIRELRSALRRGANGSHSREQQDNNDNANGYARIREILKPCLEQQKNMHRYGRMLMNSDLGKEVDVFMGKLFGNGVGDIGTRQEEG